MTLRSARTPRPGLAPGPRVEVLPPPEQPYAPADAAAPLVTRDDRGRVVSAAAASAMAKMPRAGVFLPRDIACAPGFEVHNRRRRRWLRKRRQELHETTGGVSHGVGAMLASAAWLYAGGEFAAEQAATKGDVDLFRTAATLTSTARQHDLAAWELAVREGDARAKRRGPIDPLAAYVRPLPPKETDDGSR